MPSPPSGGWTRREFLAGSLAGAAALVGGGALSGCPGGGGNSFGIGWQRATPWGIQLDDAGRTWQAGRVSDLLFLDSSHVLASAFGVWSLSADANAPAVCI